MRRKLPRCGTLLVAAAVAAASAAAGFADDQQTAGGSAAQAPPRLPAFNLLLWRDAAGATHPVRSLDDWQLRRAEILRGMQAVMGPLPGAEKRCPLDIQVSAETDCGSYVRRLISYQSEPHSRTPAWLCIPKIALDRQAVVPGVLCPHPTNNKIGHDVVVGLGGDPGRAYAQELAERGYVTIAPSYPLLAKYQPDVRGLGYQSGTMKAIWDNIRALDVLDSLSYVQHGGYGAIGHSLGGHNTVFTAVFEPRIVAVVSSCGLDSFVDYKHGDPANWQPEKGWCQLRYMPRMADYAGRLDQIPFDFAELIGALAPRPVFINAPLRDSNFQWQSVDRIAAAAGDIYRLYGQPDKLRVEHPDCEHSFPDEMRAVAYEVLDKALKPK